MRTSGVLSRDITGFVRFLAATPGALRAGPPRQGGTNEPQHERPGGDDDDALAPGRDGSEPPEDPSGPPDDPPDPDPDVK